MIRITQSVAWFLLAIVVVLLLGITSLSGTTAADLSGTIDLKASHLTNSGFDSTDCLITETNTLYLVYSNDVTVDFITNRDAVTNNNWCERTNDSVAPYKDAISSSELTGMWVTWDTNYLYVAIRGQAKGRNNNLMCMIDSNPVVGNNDFLRFPTGQGHWRRDILFDEGIIPNIYLGFWCVNDTAQYPGGTHLRFGDGLNNWQSGVESADQATPGDFFSWYNGSSQPDPAQRLWMFRVNWSVITNPDFVSSTADLKIRITAASTGPDDGSLMYDYMPETQYTIKQGSVHTIQNNYFIISAFDGAGNLRLGVNPRDVTTVWFNPGSRWDVANYPDGKMKVEQLDDNGLEVKAFTPNGDGNNDVIKFAFRIENRSLLRCQLKIYDLKGRLVRKLFPDLRTLPLVGSSTYYNGPATEPDHLDYPDLTWNGRTGPNPTDPLVPMGIYIVVFEGEDGTIKLLSKRSLTVLR